MALFKVSLLILTVLFLHHASGELRCWDCSPSDEGKCLNPKASNAKSTICDSTSSAKKPQQVGLKKQISDIEKTELEPRALPGDITYECYTVYFESTGEDPSGVYRGCGEKDKTTVTVCDFLPEIIEGGKITECRACSENLCNVHDVGGGAAALSVSLSILLINTVICLYIVDF